MYDSNLKLINIIYISGQIYSNPKEIRGKNQNGSGEWIIRKVKIMFDNNQWIDLIFEDPELWSKVKNIPIGYYISVSGKLKNSFSRKNNTSKAQIEVIEVIDTSIVKTTLKNKLLMTKETIKNRKTKKIN